ncbi:MAG: carbonic anhydrase family protein [Anaerolineae bacterium]
MLKTPLLVLTLLLLLCLALAPAAFADGPPHWTYEGPEGPEFWGSLSPDYALCSTGKQQSPVDIPSSAALNPADLKFDYKPSPLNVLNNGHTIQGMYEAGSTLTVDGVPYKLVQFHFHNPSEHEANGKLDAMELHLVHQNADGGLAVVGVWIEPGAENKALAPVFSNLPKEQQEAKVVPGATVNAAGFLPATQTYYRYDGSLTTPPCTQGVKWLVMSTPVTASAEQLAAYKAIMYPTNRPVQALNGRQFLLTSQVGSTTTTPTTLPVTGAAENDAAAALIFALGLLTAGAGVAARRRAAAHNRP